MFPEAGQYAYDYSLHRVSLKALWYQREAPGSGARALCTYTADETEDVTCGKAAALINPTGRTTQSLNSTQYRDLQHGSLDPF